MSNSILVFILVVLFGGSILLILVGAVYLRLKPSANPLSFSSEELSASLKTNLQCPKCNGEMEVGYIPDYFLDGSEAYIRLSMWVKGYPERHWFGGLKIMSKKRRFILTYCCSVCGYIESYAANKQETKALVSSQKAA